MATFNKSAAYYLAHVMQLPLAPFCVKRIGAKINDAVGEDVHDFGRIHTPYIASRQVANNGELYEVVSSHCCEVVVVGHGLGMPGDTFVWRGTAEEFAATWEGD